MKAADIEAVQLLSRKPAVGNGWQRPCETPARDRHVRCRAMVRQSPMLCLRAPHLPILRLLMRAYWRWPLGRPGSSHHSMVCCCLLHFCSLVSPAHFSSLHRMLRVRLPGGAFLKRSLQEREACAPKCKSRTGPNFRYPNQGEAASFYGDHSTAA